MKILVLGDIHGRTIWKEIIEKESPDKVIFLGDYVSTHDSIDSDSQITNFENILQYKEAHMDSTILLLGNHDLQHMGYPWAECSGYFKEVEKYMTAQRDRILSLCKLVHIDNELKIIFSHAGVSTEWMKNVAKINYIHDIVKSEPSEIFGFWPSKLSDYYGISPTQPPTWIRPQTLIEYMPEGWTQVVGHTPMKKLVNVGELMRNGPEKYSCPDLWCCDTLGDNSYLIIENGEFITIN